MFYTTANDGYIRIWNWENKSLLLKENFDFFVQKAEFSFDDKYLVLIGDRNFVKIIDLANYKIISEFEIPAPGLGSNLTLSIHPNNEYLAVGGVEGKIYIYDLQEILASQSKIDDWVTYE